jgi:hypothetical protein
MSHKHPRKAAAPAPQRNAVPTTPMPKRHRMLYVLVAVSVAAIGGGIYASWPTLAGRGDAQAATVASEQPSAGGTLASMAPFFNFGTVSMRAGKVVHKYAVSNIGSSPVTITRLSTSCMCTEATLVTASARRGPFGMEGHAPIPSIREQLGVGEMAQVEVVFDPAAHGPAGVGRIDRTVTLQNSAGRPLELAFTAMVTP